jgi:hypothetical protein
MAARAGAIALLLACGCSGAAGWTAVEPALDRDVLSVWAAAPDDVYAVGGGLGSPGLGALVLRSDGQRFHELPTGRSETLWWVWGSSASDVWMVGEQGLVLRWDGARFQVVPVPPEASGKTLFGVWGSGAGDVWAVGGVPDDSGVVLHGDASGLELAGGLPATPGVAYFKVWGSSASDVFVVGQGNTILHFDGHAWTPQASPAPPLTTLFTVAGRSASEVYAVGGTGQSVLLRFDGASWTAATDPLLAASSGLTGVAVGPGGALSLVGFGGTKLRGHDRAFVRDDAPVTTLDLHATFIDSAGVIWATGGNYLAPAGAARRGVIVRYGP